MTIASAPDTVTYLIVVRGMLETAYDAFTRRFPEHRGGVNPRLAETYLTVECELAELDANLGWITENLTAQYRSIELGVSIFTPRNWSNFDMPPEAVNAAHRYAASIRVMFASPAVSHLGQPHDA